MDNDKLKELEQLQFRIRQAEIDLDYLVKLREECKQKVTTFELDWYRGGDCRRYIHYYAGTDDADKLIREHTIKLNALKLQFKEA